MKTREERLLILADFVLRTLESSEEWGSDETDAIAECAIELELADTDENGYFKRIEVSKCNY